MAVSGLIRGRWLLRLLRHARARVDPRHRLIERLIVRADRARDTGRYDVAAVLYEEILSIAPERGALHTLYAHMLKDGGNLADAERHYVEGALRRPWSADAPKQLASFYRLTDRPDEALAAKRRSWVTRHAAATEAMPPNATTEAEGRPEQSIASELLPAMGEVRRHRESAHIARLGTRRVPGLLGQRVLRGVEAIRGHCITRHAVDTVEVHVAKRLLCRERVGEAALLGSAGDTRKYVFNVWHDFSAFPPGRHAVEFRFRAADATVRVMRDSVVVAPPLSVADHPDSDSVVVVREGAPGSLEERVNALPSEVRDARRSLLGREPGAILVQRVDQLGDMVVSVSAVRRLRALFPEARLVGLLSPANADFARTLDLFDDSVAVTFAEDLEGRRVMPLADQQALRDRLAPFDFDVAIDLSESSSSRPLLRLSGAPLLFGFDDRQFPWLTGGFETHVRDQVNGLERTPPSGRALALVERVGAALRPANETIPRPELSRELLRPHGLAPGDRYIVLHAGARLAYSRWPHFEALAALLLTRTELKVVVLSEDAEEACRWAGERAPDRLRLVEGRLAFDQLDALLVHAEVVVANDSGLKHLAALRGTPVVSLHMARLNWNEWGQELSGSIISRRVPCAGCGIALDPAECGKNFACLRHISPEEVFRVALDLLE